MTAQNWGLAVWSPAGAVSSSPSADPQWRWSLLCKLWCQYCELLLWPNRMVTSMHICRLIVLRKGSWAIWDYFISCTQIWRRIQKNWFENKNMGGSGQKIVSPRRATSIHTYIHTYNFLTRTAHIFIYKPISLDSPPNLGTGNEIISDSSWPFS